MHRHFYSPVRFGAGMGFLIALLSIPVFINIGLYDYVSNDVWLTIAWCVFVPLISAVGLEVALMLPLPRALTHQFFRYGIVGVFNTLFNLALFNTLLYIFGVAVGLLVPIFAGLSSVVVITVAYFLNTYFVFDAPQAHARGYTRFFLVTGGVALLDTFIIAFLVNVVRAPSGITPELWANIALIATIPVSVLGNFLGYKLLVFRRRV
jgi:putative flippase GtrA